MKTRNVLIICITMLLVAWMKYVIPVMERAAEREMQWQIFLRALHGRPSLQIVPEPEAHRL
jgi:hypothetical protein